MKRPRQARLGVRLWWIVPSIVVASLLSTQVAREPSAPDVRAKSQVSSSPRATLPIVPTRPSASGEEEQNRSANHSIPGPKLLDDLRPPLLERSMPAATPPASVSLDGVKRQAWEELFHRPALVELGRRPNPVPTPAVAATSPVSAPPAPTPFKVVVPAPAPAPVTETAREAGPLARAPQIMRPMAAAIRRHLPTIPAVPKSAPAKPRTPAPTSPPTLLPERPADFAVATEVVPTPLDVTMGSQMVRSSTKLTPAIQVESFEKLGPDPFIRTFETTEPQLIEPVVKKKAEPKNVRQWVREVFTAAPLPKSEPVVAKKDPPKAAKKADDVVVLPKLPELPPDFGKKAQIDSAVQRAVAQTLEPPKTDSQLRPVSGTYCLDCGRRGGLTPYDHIGPHGRCSSCGSRGCVPGRKPCYPCESNTVIGGFLCDLYDCICCPDPCYEPKWVPLTDAAFFAAGPRPVSQMRFGWDSARNLIYPDRSEFFWARADGRGKGPAPVPPALGETRVRYEEATMYTETAVGGFSTFIEMPYRSMDPERAPHAAGFGDMSLGTKSLLFDCELLLVTFQFRTILPMGQPQKGLGTGHTTLEPSLLFALKLGCDTYLQGQLSEWIPLGGDPDYAGSVFHSHFSLNHVLCRLMPDVPLIGTLEASTWSFHDGAYTDPISGSGQRSSGNHYVSLGPGLRLFVCDKLDFGVGTAFAMTDAHFAHTLTRVVFRYRF